MIIAEKNRQGNMAAASAIRRKPDAPPPLLDTKVNKSTSSVNQPLGINAKFCDISASAGTDYLIEHRERLYKLQRSAAFLHKTAQDEKLVADGFVPGSVDSRLGYHRVCFCHWARWADSVSVNYSEEHKRALYKGVQVCASWSACPVCGAKISERRRVKLAAAVKSARARGYVTALGTLTVSHQAGNDLGEQVDDLYARWHDVRRSYGWKLLVKQYGIEGPGRSAGVKCRLYSVTGFDYTWGYNGHHAHLHPLFFLAPGSDVAAFGRALADMWYAVGGGTFVALRSTGELVATDTNAFQRGCKVTSNDCEVADYITKFGRLPRWDVDREVAKSAVKRGRGEHSKHYTAIELLESYSLTGNKEHGAVWLEYASAMKGRHQLTWSPGLAALLEVGEVEQSDVELAGEVSDFQCELAFMSPKVWHLVCVEGLRAALLAVGDKGDSLAVELFLTLLVRGELPGEQEKQSG